MKSILLVFVFVPQLLTLKMSAQHDTSKINIGISFTQLVSGTPELMVDYFFHDYFGISINSGYNYKTVNGFIKVGDVVDIEKQHGTYFKVGLKMRIYSNTPYVTPFVQLFYVGSFYNEMGMRQDYNNAGSEIPVSASGYVNGCAAVTGADFRVCSKLAFKVALQVGSYRRTDHLKYPSNTFQPGLGVEGILLTNQLLAGLVYKL